MKRDHSCSSRPLAQVPSYAHLLDRSSSSSSSSSSVSEKEDDDQRPVKASSCSETSPTKTKQKNKTALKKRVLLSSFSSSSDENDKTLVQLLLLLSPSDSNDRGKERNLNTDKIECICCFHRHLTSVIRTLLLRDNRHPWLRMRLLHLFEHRFDVHRRPRPTLPMRYNQQRQRTERDAVGKHPVRPTNVHPISNR